MNNSSFITVWEWEVQPCLWVPYEPKMCRYIENAFRLSKGRINLGVESPELACFEINFGVLRQENVYTKELTRIRQQQYPFTCPLAKGILWMWWSDFRWELYDVPTMIFIEDEFQKHSQYVDLSLSPLRIPNIIHFTNMVQINTKTQKSRNIQRIKTNEQYPLAVFQTQSTASGTVRNNVLQYPVSQLWPFSTGLVQHGSNTFPTHGRNGVTTHTTGTSSNLLLHPPGLPNNVSTNGVRYVAQAPGASCLYSSPSTSALHHPLKRFHDEDDGLSGSSSAQKKLKSNGSLGGPLASFTLPVTLTGRADDDCAICLESLTNPSEYDLTDPELPPAEIQCISPDILKFVKCRHMFHRICLQKMYNTGAKVLDRYIPLVPANGCLQCPTCKTIHGEKRGNQPCDGTMDVQTAPRDIPGYPGCGSIVIVYNFQGGIQGDNHPNPGQPYTANGFPRTCYLPNSTKGKKVLWLLQKAFDRQLIFTIGTSATTGFTNTIVWNDIHHKSEGYQNRTGHGYPDPTYLDNVLEELAAHGVTDEAD